MRLASLVPPLLSGLALLSATGPARAIEGQWHVGGGIGAATFARTDTGFGPLLGIHAAYELDDMFDARLELSASRHQFADDLSTDFYGAALGFTYKVDVIEWVPYVGLLVGYYAFSSELRPAPLAQRELGIMVPLGLEYVPSSSWALGLQIAYHGFLSDPMDSLGDAPYVTALLRAEARFGR
jgi:hypothetical protein